MAGIIFIMAFAAFICVCHTVKVVINHFKTK